MNESPERIEQFKQEIAAMKVRAPQAENERWLLIGGVVLMVLGIIFIVVGYWGASGTNNDAEAISFLISGGVLGLGLTVVGAALFVRYSMSRYLRFWLVRMIYEEQANTDRTVAAIERLGRDGSKS